MASIKKLKTRVKSMEAKKNTDPKLLIQSYRSVVEQEGPVNPESALKYAEKALVLAKKSRDNTEEALCFRYRASCHRFLGNYSQSIEDTKSEILIWEYLKDAGDPAAEQGISGGFNNLGTLFSEQGNFKNAYEYFLKAFEIKKVSGSKWDLSMIYRNLGNLEMDQGDLENAKDHFTKSLSTALESKNDQCIAISYKILSNFHITLQEYPTALKYAELGLELFTKLNNSLEIAACHNIIGHTLLLMGAYSKALEYSTKAYDVLKTKDNQLEMLICNHTIGNIHLNLDDFEQSKSFFNRALSIALKMGYKLHQITILQDTAKLHEAKGDYPEAIKNMRESMEIKELVYNEETQKKISRLKVQYETERKEKEAEILKLKNEELQKEITERKHVEEELKKYHDHLEEMVRKRTAELVDANRGLEKEIHERSLAEEARKVAEGYLHSFLEHVDDLVYHRDIDGNISDLKNTFLRLSGYNSGDLENDPELWVNIIHPEDVDMIKEFFVSNLEGAAFHEYEYRLQAKSGKWFWLHSHMVGVQNKEGNYTGYNCIDRNITKRKDAEKSLKNSFEMLKTSFEGTISIISRMIEARDPYTSGHQTRTADIAGAIATSMELPDDKVMSIYFAAMVHDIGKIKIPLEILNRPGELSTTEMELIKVHPQTGYEILNGIEFPWPIADIVLQHHEFIDGSGYPAGLPGDKIMLEAQIICVADTLEAMSSHRPYRPTLGMDHALKEISNNAGILYNREVVSACLEVVKRGPLEFQKHFFFR